MTDIILTAETASQHHYIRCQEIGMDDYYIMITYVTKDDCLGVNLSTGRSVVLEYDDLDPAFIYPATADEIRKHLQEKIEKLNQAVEKATNQRDEYLADLNRVLLNIVLE